MGGVPSREGWSSPLREQTEEQAPTEVERRKAEAAMTRVLAGAAVAVTGALLSRDRVANGRYPRMKGESENLAMTFVP